MVEVVVVPLLLGLPRTASLGYVGCLAGGGGRFICKFDSFDVGMTDVFLSVLPLLSLPLHNPKHLRASLSMIGWLPGHSEFFDFGCQFVGRVTGVRSQVRAQLSVVQHRSRLNRVYHLARVHGQRLPIVDREEGLRGKRVLIRPIGCFIMLFILDILKYSISRWKPTSKVLCLHASDGKCLRGCLLLPKMMMVLLGPSYFWRVAVDYTIRSKLLIVHSGRARWAQHRRLEEGVARRLLLRWLAE